MKAMILTKFGPPEVLQLQEIATPTPKDKEVLIRIFATTVTAGDCELRGLKTPLWLRLPIRIGVGLFRRIRREPLILGQELAGAIEAVGSQVTRFKPGDQVVGWVGLRLGTYAEYKCLPEDGVLFIKPSMLTSEEAAALPIGGLDAVYFMRKGQIQRGDKVVIVGAGGSIGTFAVQLAKHFGAEVTAVDRGEKLELLRSIGADYVIDYTQADFTTNGENYDVIFDVVGKSSFSRSVRALKANGRYLLGNAGLSQRVRRRWMSRGSSKQIFIWAPRTASEYAEDFAFLTGLMVEGRITSVIDRRYPLEQLSEAHRYVDTGQKQGHVVITVGQNSRP